MPLLMEAGWHKRCDKLVFVDCKPEIRYKRAQNKGINDIEQLKNKEKFQISLDNKEIIADNAIDNNTSFSAVVRQVTEIYSRICG